MRLPPCSGEFEAEWDQAVKREIEHRVRGAAYSIIEGKGATYYGIGAGLSETVSIILKDQRSIMTVCTPIAEVAGVSDVTLALPHLVGGRGILTTFPLSLNAEEEQQLQKSASILRTAIDELDDQMNAEA